MKPDFNPHWLDEPHGFAKPIGDPSNDDLDADDFDEDEDDDDFGWDDDEDDEDDD